MLCHVRPPSPLKILNDYITENPLWREGKYTKKPTISPWKPHEPWRFGGSRRQQAVKQRKLGQIFRKKQETQNIPVTKFD
jgi:hypothetical protein